jgi:outer membrane lipoprotein
MKAAAAGRAGKVLLIAALLAAMAGCSVVSSNVREQAADLSFDELAENPSAHAGKTVVLGGYVADVRNFSDRSRVMVLQAPLDFQDHPKPRQLSEGRFIAVADGFLDPMVYEKGRKVTVAGRVIGEATEKISEYAYHMPKIRVQELHLWEEWEYRRPYSHDDLFSPWPGSSFYHRWYPPYHW